MSFIWWDHGERHSQGASRTGDFMTAHEQNKLMHKKQTHPAACIFNLEPFLSPRFVSLKPASLAFMWEYILPTFSQWDCRFPRNIYKQQIHQCNTMLVVHARPNQKANRSQSNPKCIAQTKHK